MKFRGPAAVAFIFAISINIAAQAVGNPTDQNPPAAVRGIDPLDRLSGDISKIAKSVESLNKNWGSFIRTFSTNQGLILTERQQKLILALEVLNRIEVSYANMQKSKLDLAERQSRVRLQLAQISDDLLPQSIDRYVSMRGTLDTDGIREVRKQTLLKEQRELILLNQQIDRELFTLGEEMRRTELQIRTLRTQVFGEVERQLSDL
jgi:hypothetical protein